MGAFAAIYFLAKRIKANNENNEAARRKAALEASEKEKREMAEYERNCKLEESLLEACREGDVKTASKILDKNPSMVNSSTTLKLKKHDIKVGFISLNNPLSVACKYGQEKIVDLLLAKNANVNVREHYYS